MSRISWSPAARGDLDRIGAWLDEHRGLEISADQLATIRRRADFLMSFPHGGRPLRDEMRVLRVFGTGHVIVYRLRERAVEIVRVHHEREDWQADF